MKNAVNTVLIVSPEMTPNFLWRLLFSGAIAILMLAILLIRTEPVQNWVLIVYPLVGAFLAQIASRTCPTSEGIAWLETGTIAAASIVVLAALINMLLIELLLREFISGEFLNGNIFNKAAFFVLPTVSALLWWALERRLSSIRTQMVSKPEQSTKDDLAEHDHAGAQLVS